MPTTAASYIIKGTPTAVVSLNTLRALFRVQAATKTMLHSCRAVSDVISSVLAGESGGHAGKELTIYT